MLTLVFKLSLICGGILLGLDRLDKLDGASEFFNKIAKTLLPFNTIIGGFSIVYGILQLVQGGCFLYHLVGVLAGLLLSITALTKVPAIGEFLEKISKTLMPFKVIIGLVALVLGVLAVLRINILC